MSIREDAYRICKSVWDSRDRERIKSLIYSLNTVSEEQSRPNKDRSIFGYAARGLNAQTLGYLLVDRDKSQIEERFPPLRWVEPLQPEERRLLAGVHQQFVDLNSHCTAPIANISPQLSMAVNPYNKFNYELTADVADVEVLTSDVVDFMAQSFHQHPSFSVVLEMVTRYAQVIGEQAPHDGATQSIIGLEKVISQSGPLNSPRGLMELAATLREDAPQRIGLRYLSALTCLRESLAILDELVFLAMMTNKLPVLTEDNIIEVGSLVHHVAGFGLALTCQPDEKFNSANTGLVLVKCSLLKHPYPNDLCRVEFMEVQSSNEFGDVIDIHVRVIDENLNPFPGLLRNI